MRPARYFPVQPGPLQMRPGLARLGTDFGNGPADARFFQRDDEAPAYAEAKAAVPPGRHRLALADLADAALARVALIWAAQTLQGEGHPLPPGADRWGSIPLDDAPALEAAWRALGAGVQEDLALVRQLEGGEDRACGVHVSFPSGWRPEAIAGSSFASIHAPVPGLVRDPEGARRMVRAMVEKGPYVRFVWTVSADPRLDHHPLEAPRDPWGPDTQEGWLRVERQVTSPFHTLRGALFLIRTYLRPFSALSGEERATLREAVAALPEAVAAYKGLATARPHVLRCLEQAGASP